MRNSSNNVQSCSRSSFLTVLATLLCSLWLGVAAPNDKTANTTAVSRAAEIRVIRAVKQWCLDQGWSEPGRVVVRQKTSNGWWVLIGPKSKEHRVRIDPKTLRILE